MAENEFTAALVREWLSCDVNGVLRWRVNRGRARIGNVTGHQGPDGYLKVGLAGRNYCAHRLVWLLTRGRWPNQDIDHIDGNRSNNAPDNLRDVSRSINSQNQRRPGKFNTSGFLGVSFNKSCSRWQATISVRKTRHHLGLFDTAEMASAAYLIAKKEIHPTAPIALEVKIIPIRHKRSFMTVLP